MTTKLDDTTFLVLNGAHLKKMATVADLAAATGVSEPVVKDAITKGVADGLAMEIDGRALIVPEGVQAVLAYYNEHYGDLRTDGKTPEWYERFETINDQFIKYVSEWQKDDSDERSLDRLLKTVERLQRSIQDLTPAIPRYQTYVDRFSASMDKVDNGDKNFVCKPTIDSVHNIWFEFHEDILSVLGRPRDVQDA